MQVEVYPSRQPAAANLVMIPGWAMNSAIWDSALDSLQQRLNLYCVDLPGLGKAHQASWPSDHWQLVDQIAAQVPAHSIWLGWSMGGLFAQQAVFRQLVSKLILVASSPNIVAREHWPFGIDAKLFAQFGAELQQDYLETLNRFLALEVLGSENASQHLARLKKVVFAHGEPSREALLRGFAVLSDTDFSDRLDELDLPTLLIGGRRDKLIPWDALEHTQQQLADAQLVKIPGAGHAPFISQPQLFAETVIEFCHG